MWCAEGIKISWVLLLAQELGASKPVVVAGCENKHSLNVTAEMKVLIILKKEEMIWMSMLRRMGTEVWLHTIEIENMDLHKMHVCKLCNLFVCGRLSVL